MSKMFKTLLGEGDQDPAFALSELAKSVSIQIEGEPKPTKIVLRCVAKTKIKDVPSWHLEALFTDDNQYTTYFEQDETGVSLDQESMGLLQSMLYIVGKVGEGDLMMIHDLRKIAQDQSLTWPQLYDAMTDMIRDFFIHGRKEVTPEKIDFNLRAGMVKPGMLVDVVKDVLDAEFALSYYEDET